MLAQFSIVPLGTGSSSLSGLLAPALKIVDESGLPYKLTPMGTVVEGDWEEVMELIRRCRDEIQKGQERVLISITIDDRKARTGRIEGKVASVEKQLGKALKK